MRRAYTEVARGLELLPSPCSASATGLVAGFDARRTVSDHRAMTRRHDWDASTYDRVADPQARWGATVLERLRLAGDEAVLDAGCGTGRVTQQLLARVPRGRVVALDGSPAMIEEARRRLAPHGDRVEFVVADLARPFEIPGGPVDAILSTATFHWVTDHDALFRNLAAVLRPGGQLVAQCGGEGNVASVIAAAGDVPGMDRNPWLFASPDETRARLEAAGFEDIAVWLNPEPTPLEPGEQLETFLATVVLREHIARLREAERAPFVHSVATGMPQPVIDYVRLNIVARRSVPNAAPAAAPNDQKAGQL
jgi:trans-aconitate 2-methyltransferase